MCFVPVNGLFGLQDFVHIVPYLQPCCFVVFRVPQPKCVNVAIDCDREIERIHSLFLINLDKLDELQSKLSSCFFIYNAHYCTCTVFKTSFLTSFSRLPVLY